jgi:hypothetical protein
MRMLMISIFALSMIGPAFAGVLTERDRGNQWFQDCEQEVARPFCGTLKIDPAVQALAWQWQKQVPLDQTAVEVPAKQSPTTSYLDQQESPEPVPQSGEGRPGPE